jgi:hypothetical protein
MDWRTRHEPSEARTGAGVILAAHPSYPVARAYVLKLHRDAKPGQGRVLGRLENVTTGEQFVFASAEELLACLARDSTSTSSRTDRHLLHRDCP